MPDVDPVSYFGMVIMYCIGYIEIRFALFFDYRMRNKIKDSINQQLLFSYHIYVGLFFYHAFRLAELRKKLETVD